MTRRLIRLVAALGLTAVPATAQEIDCSTAMAQSDLNQCAYQDWEEADGRLNTVYKQVVATYTQLDADLPKELGSGVATLREAQRAWITFRDKACEAEGFAMRGGSAEPLLVYGCMRALTEERIGHLQGMLDGYGG
ncbi:lysozyme inhibitor LprI family protein [Rhodobacter sp. SY28-1]|uniref:lysozyme inhibitor LprI family protein n=1 Tax=Rhodobacter sp. SY28-1 TaxID=2562317 RepID=UPI001F0DF526|nr:lysozyme inhibitor LprI family protein [Rhodobacter sp. SY28-1]